MNQTNYLSEKHLAKQWGISYRTLQDWRLENKGPAYLKIGGGVRYAKEAIEAFELSHFFATQIRSINGRKKHLHLNKIREVRS